MEDLEREYIEIENDFGEVEKAEIICTIKSERDDKEYVVLTQDEEIGEEVNIVVGILKEENGETTFVEVDDDSEYEYVVSLMEKIESSDSNVL